MRLLVYRKKILNPFIFNNVPKSGVLKLVQGNRKIHAFVDNQVVVKMS